MSSDFTQHELMGFSDAIKSAVKGGPRPAPQQRRAHPADAAPFAAQKEAFVAYHLAHRQWSKNGSYSAAARTAKDKALRNYADARGLPCSSAEEVDRVWAELHSDECFAAFDKDSRATNAYALTPEEREYWESQ